MHPPSFTPHVSSSPLLLLVTPPRHASSSLPPPLLSPLHIIPSLTPSTPSSGDDPCDRCNVPKRRFDFRYDEMLRNCRLLGLPSPSYPVEGLQRTEVPSA